MFSRSLSLLRRQLAPAALLLLLQPGLTVTANTATVKFPDSVDFHLAATSPSPVDTAQIEVKTGALTCGGGSTRAAPDKFTAGASITADWTWELRQTGALPPGTVVSWSWDAHTAAGQTLSTPEQQVTLDDTAHSWQKLTSTDLLLQWYTGDQSFAQALQTSAEAGIKNLHDQLGVTDDQQIHIYLYATSTDMQAATLYAPSWSGGLAFAPENTLLLAVGPGDLTWGQRAIKHELTHVIVDRHTFSCVNSTPTWFEEGLAMYFEGPPDPSYTGLLKDAVKGNVLLSVRELGNGMSGDPRLATLGYAESVSLVTFLVDQYGKDKLLRLLDQWKAGEPQDKALMTVYSLDRDGLEAAWRKSIGAQPMKPVAASVKATPTLYPTLVPLAGAPLAATEIIPTPAYLSAPAGASTQPSAAPAAGAQPGVANSGLNLTLLAGIVCGALIVLLALAGVVIWLARRSRANPAPTDPPNAPSS